jgi:urease accessory protein
MNTSARAQAASGASRATSDAADQLQLMWLASPALPIGGFSYSEVLESAIERMALGGAADVGHWLHDQLLLVQARCDMPLVAQAIDAWRAGDHRRVSTLNDWVLQTRESSELRLQTEQMGRSLMDWLRHQQAENPERVGWTRTCPSPTYPVAFALAASFTGASTAACLHSFAFGWAENMVQAAVKAVPLGQSAGQRILAELVQAIPDAVTNAIAVDDDSRQAFAPMFAILSAQHETQYSRLFRS